MQSDNKVVDLINDQFGYKGEYIKVDHGKDDNCMNGEVLSWFAYK